MVYIAEVFVLVGVGLAILAYPDVLIVHAQRLLAGIGWSFGRAGPRSAVALLGTISSIAALSACTVQPYTARAPQIDTDSMHIVLARSHE